MSQDFSLNPNLPFFLKTPHRLFSISNGRTVQLDVSVDPLIVDAFGRQYGNAEEVIEDSSGERIHLYTLDGRHRLEIPFYGVLPPYHGYFISKRYVKDEDVWECEQHGEFVALPSKK